MAYLAKTLFPASGYTVDKGDYIPTEVIGQAHTTLISAGYVVEIPDDPEKDQQFYDERGNHIMEQQSNQNPRELIPGVVPPPYETHSAIDADPADAESDPNTEGKRVLDPSSAAAGGMVGIDQEPVGPASADAEQAEADQEVVEANKDANATDGAKDLANSEGVLLSDVEGSGDNGRIQKSDVEEYLESEV